MSEHQPTLSPDDDRIARRAHSIWMQEGCPEGRDQAHWQQAEAELSGEDAGKTERGAVVAPDLPLKRRKTAKD